MPELPEVETVKTQLQKFLLGSKIIDIKVLSDKQVNYDNEFRDKLINKTFKSIDRIAKNLIFSFVEEPNLYLVTHLKMTGQLLLTTDNNILGGGHSQRPADLLLPHQHTRIIYFLNDSKTLYFNDMRKFGYMKIFNRNELKTFKQKFGIEPIKKSYNFNKFYQLIKTSHLPIKVLLLDQTKIAGLGNIYVDESLWRAKIRPNRLSNSLIKKEAKQLFSATANILKESIAMGGTTFKNFTDTNGTAGNFSNKLQVYNRQGMPCVKCGTLIEKFKLRGRGTHFCPKCQKMN